MEELEVVFKCLVCSDTWKFENGKKVIVSPIGQLYTELRLCPTCNNFYKAVKRQETAENSLAIPNH